MTDLGLPDMNGRDLVATLRRQRPDLHVVLVTGDPEAAGEVENAIAVIKLYVEANMERAWAALSDSRRWQASMSKSCDGRGRAPAPEWDVC